MRAAAPSIRCAIEQRGGACERVSDVRRAVGPDERFCGECGAPVAQRCHGLWLTAGAGKKFCTSCGTPTAVEPETTPGRAAPEIAVAGELRVVSVIFCDLVGFTSRSEALDPDIVRELLSGYFDDARAIIGRHGGTIEKFIGDAVMAVWGVPIALENDAERAVRASLELVDAVHAFGEAHQLEGLAARVGVVTGQAVAMDSVEEGIVVGDRVNTAARIQGLAEPGTVYVDETTRAATAAAIAYRDAGEHLVKGKAEPVPVWRAERAIAGALGVNRGDGLEAELVGRDSELRLIKELFHTSAERRGARLRVDRGSGRGRQVAAGLGVRQVRRRPGPERPLAPRPVPLLRRRRRLLGPHPDRAPALRHRRAGCRTTWCAPSCAKAWTS